MMVISIFSGLSGRGAMEANSSSFFAAPLASPHGLLLYKVGQIWVKEGSIGGAIYG
jgi:hypothetical protein